MGEAAGPPPKGEIMRLSEVLSHVRSDLYEIDHDGDFDTLEQCTHIRGTKALTYLENIKYLHYLENKNISCVICRPEHVSQIPSGLSGIVTSQYPKAVFFKIHNYLLTQKEPFPSEISPSAKISSHAYIAPTNVKIGENVEIGPFVCIFENTIIENNVRICAGSIIGGQSFNNVEFPGEGNFLVRDAGRTIIRENAEICSNCHIACGTLEQDATIIGRHCKMDALVHIGHGTVVGDRTLLPAGVIVSGNCVIGSDCWIGVNATISNQIHIEENSRVSLGAVVTKDVLTGQTVTGNFAIDHKKFLSNLKKSLEE